MVKAGGGKVWSPLHADLSEFKVKEAHELGMQVVVWTVNDPAQIKKMLDFGVDGIITDRPDLVRQVMAERKMPLPPVTRLSRDGGWTVLRQIAWTYCGMAGGTAERGDDRSHALKG